MNPEEIVKQAEAAYDSLDLDRIMALFHPEIVVYWNGKKGDEGLEEVRSSHEEFIRTAKKGDHWVRKKLWVASGNKIAGEWESYSLEDDGKYYHGYGGEFWKIRDGLLVEWRAYYVEELVNDE